jgi:hypothetical protein
LTLGDRLAVGCLALNQETKVRPLLPELDGGASCLDSEICSGVVAAGTRSLSLKQVAVGSIPTHGTVRG